MGMFIFGKDVRGTSEITLRFQCIFQGGIFFPCGQVQPLSWRPLVRNNVIHFILFFIIYEVRRGLREGRTICFSLVIRK